MHKFYLTNNLGGGGTNVSRFVDYKQLFDLPNIGLLLNYYYLSCKAKIKFDTKLLQKITSYDHIGTFLNDAKVEFSKSRFVSDEFNQNLLPTNINGYMLDNGCGNILRDLLQANNYTTDSIHDLVEPFHDFAEQLHFDFAIALDCAMKYTYKDKENQDKQLTKLWKELASDKDKNLALINTTLEIAANKQYTHGIYAPIHGFNYDSFADYLESILKAENKNYHKFDGFALGGIADARQLKNEIWGVPNKINKDIKSAYIVSRLCNQVRKVTQRPLHVLGAGTIYTLPFIINAGASSSDCHSAWRRSSDGGYDKAKILVPLLNDNLEFINDHDALQFVHIKNLKDEYQFDFGLSIPELKKLFQSENKEDFYFAEIITFYAAIKQYNLLIRYCQEKADYIQCLSQSPDKVLNADYQKLAETLKL